MKHLGRKIFHLVGGLGLLATYYISGRDAAFEMYGGIIVLALAFEIARMKVPAVNDLLYSRFSDVIRVGERNKITGIIPYVLGVGLSLYAFPQPVATAAVCFLAFGDVAATTIGERFGKIRIGDKSLEGSAAFLFASLMAGFVLTLIGMGLTPWVMIVGAVAATVIEVLPMSLNDNLAIPILSGAVMYLALALTR